MTRIYKHILLAVAALLVVVLLMGNFFLTRLVRSRIDSSLAQLDSPRVSYGDLRLLVLSGRVWIEDIAIEHDGVEVRVDQLSLDGIAYHKWLIHKRLVVEGITITHPQVTTVLPPAKPSSESKNKADAAPVVEPEAIGIIKRFLHELIIQRISIENASLALSETTSDLAVQLDSFSLEVHDLGYSLIDSIPYSYNDSVYAFTIGEAHILTPDSMLRIDTRDIAYRNGGALTIGKTHLRHTVDPFLLAPRMGGEPRPWIDLEIGEVRTSHKNLVRDARTLGSSFTLDSVYARIDKMTLFKDTRVKPSKPHQIMQEVIRSARYPMTIHRLEADLETMHIRIAVAEDAVGQMQIGRTHASVSNITDKPGQTIYIHALAHIGKGRAAADMQILLNEENNWNLKLDARDIDLHFMDDFLYPIASMRIGCDVQRLRARYGGTGMLAKGMFCMEYTDLAVQAYKESPSPIKVVKNLSGTINSFAKTCLPHENPSALTHRKRAYNIEWKNDLWKEPALYYIGPIIDGAMKTMLPGLFVKDIAVDYPED